MRNIFEKIGEMIINIVDWFYFPFLHFLPREIFRYAATGGANTLLDISLYFIFYRYVIKMQIVDLGFVAISPHIAAFLLVFPITFTTGFFLAKYVTFTSSELKGRIQLFRYLLTVGGSIVLNYVFLKLFVEYFGMYATMAKIITTLLVIIYSYMAQRYFTFKTGKKLVAARNRS
ncbi:GtrA family protein [Draconibacterium sp. IB214405]|uniref:GtrA family protein n=1 Tax=Draconibacterium sp. IB214405 TaxID=3097352 RepID=UPI002A108AF8|nr:GtrA family protein [Draconibacterium sp. IB214405]MDX8339613.1 GtrA family protein [Draconibacterium sp. IB214405]